MDLLSGLSESMWKNSAPNNVKGGLKPYIVIRHKLAQKGKWEISVREDVEDAVMQVAILEGVTGKNNPLSSVRNVELKLDGTRITAINLDDDCVVRK